MKLILPDSVASPQDLAVLMNEVHVYAKWASQEIIKQKVAGKSAGAQPTVSPATSEVIRQWNGGKPLTQAMLDSLIKALETYKKSAPVITMTLASVPSGELRSKLVGWARSQLRPDVLISFKLNRHILGGMVVACGSHIFDWSFRRKVLTTNIQFHEVLGNV